VISFYKKSIFLINQHESIEDSSTLIGNRKQNIRLLLHIEYLSTITIGQEWLLEIDSLNGNLTHGMKSKDQRFSPT